MNRSKPYPTCPFDVSDCFALFKDHKCYCLERVDFKHPERGCPFYKKSDNMPGYWLNVLKKERKQR